MDYWWGQLYIILPFITGCISPHHLGLCLTSLCPSPRGAVVIIVMLQSVLLRPSNRSTNCQLSLYCLLNIRHVGEVWLCDSCPQRFLLAEGQSYGGFVSHQILIMSLLRRVPARRLQVLHCHYFVKHRMSAKNNTAAAASKNVRTRVEAQG